MRVVVERGNFYIFVGYRDLVLKHVLNFRKSQLSVYLIFNIFKCDVIKDETNFFLIILARCIALS